MFHHIAVDIAGVVVDIEVEPVVHIEVELVVHIDN